MTKKFKRRFLAGLTLVAFVIVGLLIYYDRVKYLENIEDDTLPLGQEQISVKDYGAVGDGMTDDTYSIQQAVNFGAANSKVVFFPDGEYMVNATTSINLLKNTELILSEGAILQAIANSSSRSYVIKQAEVSDVHIKGGRISGEQDVHTGLSSDSGHGILIWDAQNVVIEDVAVDNCMNDGVYIGGTANKTYNVTLNNLVIENNRRQGITITSGDEISVLNTYIANTNGTLPACAIDIEPNSGNVIKNIYLENIISENNGGRALTIYPLFGVTDQDVNINVKGITSMNDFGGGIMIGGIKDRVNEMNIDIEELEVSGKSNGIVLQDIGGGCNINISGNIHTEGDKAAAVVADRNSNREKQTITGIPDILIDIKITGVGSAFYWASNNALDTNMSKGIDINIDNVDTERYANIIGNYSVPTIDIEKKKNVSALVYRNNNIRPMNTMQGSSIIINTNSKGDNSYKIINSQYVEGAVVSFKSDSTFKFIITLDNETNTFTSYNSNKIYSNHKGDEIKLRKTATGDWEVITVIGNWQKY